MSPAAAQVASQAMTMDETNITPDSTNSQNPAVAPAPNIVGFRILVTVIIDSEVCSEPEHRSSRPLR